MKLILIIESLGDIALLAGGSMLLMRLVDYGAISFHF